MCSEASVLLMFDLDTLNGRRPGDTAVRFMHYHGSDASLQSGDAASRSSSNYP
jgi:hypothetical protein